MVKLFRQTTESSKAVFRLALLPYAGESLGRGIKPATFKSFDLLEVNKAIIHEPVLHATLFCKFFAIILSDAHSKLSVKYLFVGMKNVVNISLWVLTAPVIYGIMGGAARRRWRSSSLRALRAYVLRCATPMYTPCGRVDKSPAALRLLRTRDARCARHKTNFAALVRRGLKTFLYPEKDGY